MDFNNSVIIQWGTFTSTTNIAYSGTFPISYTTNYVVMSSTLDRIGAGCYGSAPNTIDTFSFGFLRQGNHTGTNYFLSCGY